MRLICLCTFLLFAPLLLRAERDSIPAGLIRLKFESLTDLLTVKLTHSTDIEEIEVNTPGTDIQLSPNSESATRLGFSYRFISFGFRFVPRFIEGNNDNAEKGKSRINGINFNLNFRHLLQELSYNRVRGYYLENTKDFNPDWTPGKPYIQFPDLVTTEFSGMTAWNFNYEFSVNAISTYSERQVLSAGSFIPAIFYRYAVHDNKAAIEPGGYTQRSNSIELLLGAGYHYNFVLKEKFYLAVGLTPAAGYVFNRITNRYTDHQEKGNQTNFIFRLDGRAGIGYNSRRFFAGIYTRMSAAAYRQQGTSVITQNDNAILQITAGYRLNAPKWLRNTVQGIVSKAGFK
ncbi:DUF4421 domain-containing protein [Pseudoflavitalea sp. G-6-1-2]|uniref:DUF4421 family protein n=1 Tax=Pseudoflavitalea sp. G-6-1-2 TaxID=2728841 RepID=UPI00146B5BD1|nr:DUF4421 family protein [Pseudoflavitalea sp. G-6-1-2]NML22922.1 DUF4421 domain-containing protein [Pseudoflavitalea sp. G-6-1-2]